MKQEPTNVKEGQCHTPSQKTGVYIRRQINPPNSRKKVVNLAMRWANMWSKAKKEGERE